MREGSIKYCVLLAVALKLRFSGYSLGREVETTKLTRRNKKCTSNFCMENSYVVVNTKTEGKIRCHP